MRGFKNTKVYEDPLTRLHRKLVTPPAAVVGPWPAVALEYPKLVFLRKRGNSAYHMDFLRPFKTPE